jgi:hypothetical protein
LDGQFVRAAGQGIRAGEEFTGNMGNFEVKVSEVEKPTSLLSVEVERFAEVDEVFMVGEDLNGEEGASEALLPGFESDDGEEFPVIDT